MSLKYLEMKPKKNFCKRFLYFVLQKFIKIKLKAMDFNMITFIAFV